MLVVSGIAYSQFIILHKQEQNWPLFAADSSWCCKRRADALAEGWVPSRLCLCHSSTCRETKAGTAGGTWQADGTQHSWQLLSQLVAAAQLVAPGTAGGTLLNRAHPGAPLPAHRPLLTRPSSCIFAPTPRLCNPCWLSCLPPALQSYVVDREQNVKWLFSPQACCFVCLFIFVFVF